MHYSNVTNQNVLCSKENFLTMPINFEDLTRTVASFSMKSGFNISVNAWFFNHSNPDYGVFPSIEVLFHSG